MEQIAIAFTGVIAVWLSQTERPDLRKYACLFGLAGQPFWFYTAYIHEQWGIFFMSFLYAWAWFRGLRTYWLKKPVDEGETSD